MLIDIALPALLLGSAVLAVPVTEQKRSGVTPVSASAENSYTPYENFAAAAYCMGGSSTWNCGSTCEQNPDFIVYAGGGDDSDTPYWYVGWSPSLKTIIVAHEGTDPTQFLSDLTDLEVLQTQLPTNLFPEASSSIWVHSGFLGAFENTASQVLSAVKTIMAAYSTSTVTVVGHSLGGAIANIDAVFLHLQIPSLTIKIITFGEPRVGNTAWANLITDSYSITRVTNNWDPIPILPFEDMGYAQPDGEIHINPNGQWNYCAGEDNPDPSCEDGQVVSILDGDIIDHLGPYGPNQVWMGLTFC